MTSFQIKAMALAALALVAVSAQADAVSIPGCTFGSPLAVTVNKTGLTVVTTKEDA